LDQTNSRSIAAAAEQLWRACLYALLIMTCILCRPSAALASTVTTWQIIRSDTNTLWETMTFTPTGATLYPDAAFEVRFVDSIEWPPGCNFFLPGSFSATSTTFHCVASNGNSVDLTASSSWQLGSNTGVSINNFCSPNSDPDNDCNPTPLSGSVNITQGTGAVPEPGSATLFIIGFGAVVQQLARKRRAR
jgi:hypothetical protein